MTLWLWLFVALFLFGGIGFFIYFFVFAEEEDEEEGEGLDGGDTLAVTGKEGGETLSETLATTTEEYRTARKSRMIALKESLEASIETRHGMESASQKDRMTMPWFMLVGSDGSGKTTLLANTGLPLPYGPAFEVDSRKKDAGRWWLYEDAVVLEAPAAAPGTTATGTTLAPEQTQAVNTSEGWNTLLHMLRSERPDSPLNGIIVTISVQDLIDSRRDPEKLADQAERVRTFLDRTRRVLGVRLPMHVLVTKCDALPGFRSLVANLPPERRSDIFGWANPNKIETPFNPDWVDFGIAAMKQSLEDLRDELLAAPDELYDSDGLFVFVSEFTELHEPLKEFVTKLVNEEERRPPLFFRGMYFCGDAIEPRVDDATAARSSGERSTVRITAEAALADTSGHHLVFLRTLFKDKIFREAGLARPVSRVHFSRDRRVVLAQAAAILFAVIGGLGLWTTLNGFSRGDVLRTGLVHDAEQLSSVLAGMAIDLDEVKRGMSGEDSIMDRRMRDAAVIELVAEMRNVEPIRKSAFIPASWFSPLPQDVRRSMVTGIESIVLPVTRERLQERVGRLLGSAGIETGEEGVYGDGDPRSLATYLRDVRALSRNVTRFNTLATTDSGTVEDLAALLEYVYAERPLGGDGALTSGDFVAALRQASAPGIDVTDQMTQSVIARSVGMVASVARFSSAQLRQRPAAEEATIRPDGDLAALRGLHTLVQLSDDSTGLVAAVEDSIILGMPLSRIVQDSMNAQLRAAAMIIGRDSIAPDDAERRLRSVITTLFGLPLMDSIAGHDIAADIEPGQRMRWDVGRLELALSLRGDFDQALLTVASAFQGRPLDRMRRAFQVQLRARALDAAASAQRFTPLGSDDPAVEVKGSLDNLDLASPRILRTAVMLDTLGLSVQGRRLTAAGARQAEQGLATAFRIFERGRYFEPNTKTVAAWLGIQPLSFAAMGVKDSIELTDKLLQHANGAWGMLGDVEKALRYLALPGMDSTRAPGLVAEWTAIVAALRGFEQADPNSTLMQLVRFVRDDMGVRDVESCRAALAPAAENTPTTDAFVLRRRHLRAAMAGRCLGGGASQAAASYDRLRALFASRLAGRFPFVDTAATASAPDVDPTAVREFYRQYDAFVATGAPTALRSDPRMETSAREALVFLDRIDSTRAFMAPLMDNDRRAPTFGLIVGDRARSWSYGEPLVVRSVVPDSADKTVQGGWAALRHASAPAGGYERIRFFHPDRKLELRLPVFPGAAPAIAAR